MTNSSIRFTYLLLLLLLPVQTILQAQVNSTILYEDADGCLRYVSDDNSNHIANFSYAGYRNGGVAIPEIAAALTIDPVAGDNTAHIQAAINQVEALTPSADGIRGAVVLGAGTYPVSGVLRIEASGVVLRGVGNGEDPATNTIIRGTGNTPEQRDLIRVGKSSSPDWNGEVPGTREQVTSEFLPAGSRSLEVAAAELYNVGDNVIVYHPSTNDWLRTVEFGSTGGDSRWAPGEIDIYYNRYITDVNIPEQKITLDAPIYDHFRRSLAQAEIYVLNEPNTLREVGVESLRIVIETSGVEDENHAWTGILLAGVEDAWVRGVTALHFGYALVDMTAASRVTVTGCNALEPHSMVTGSRRYNFNVSRFTSNILFTGCTASNGRHSFVSNGTSSAAGIVFHNSITTGDLNSSEGHRRWSQGLLFDQLTFQDPQTSRLMGLYNRGDFGTGHGWSLTNSVAWNVRMPNDRTLSVQRPPGRQNFAIGCFGNVTGTGPFPKPAGYIELTGQDLAIPSLYDAQLAERLTKGIGPDAPVLTAASRRAGGVDLAWTDIASRETGYAVAAYQEGENEFTIVANLPANTSEYYHENVEAIGNTLRYRVFALGASCPSPFSNQLTVDFVDNVREARQEDLIVLPNPVGDLLTIQSEQRISRVQVYNVEGRLVTDTINSLRINSADWSPGLYLLRIETNNGEILSSRVIKQ
ncbi:T9SS type A sorting domain-containing protein [Neolewinella persica]|uniref:T9SS type A sorting domain-containing protein n=1 Tax=Neolewinella persica TaxID=70998 RepID=UPI000362B2D4|nr:T9SS type A sorting domain-containing protein [Neolewinella persica]